MIALKEEADIEPERVKDILEAEDESLSVETQLIRMAGFLKDRYGSSMIQSLRTVVPVRKKTRKKTRKRN